jgi:SPP1 gp7 family putative phage head morphogenesis protein
MPNRKYWEERSINKIVQAEQSVLDYEQTLLESYELALAEIQKEIDAFYGKYSKLNKIPYAEVRKHLSAGELKSFQAELKSWLKKAQELNMNQTYSEELKTLSQRVQLTRLEYLEASIRNKIEVLKAEQNVDMNDLSSANYAAGYYQTSFDVAQGLGMEVNFTPLTELAISNAIKVRFNEENFSSNIWKDRDKLISTIHVILPQSFSRGLNSKQLGDMIAREMNTSKNKGRALARTEINFLCNQASLASYKDMGLEEYEFVATLDMLTSEICRDMDGFIGKISQAAVNVNYPPMHVNCRSTTIPKVDNFKSQYRAAKDSNGKSILVPGTMTQEEWIKTYVPEEQQEKLLKFIGKYRPVD